STPGSQFRIEFFSSPAPPPGQTAQGRTFLGFTNVTTGPAADVVFSFSPASALTLGQAITATATDAAGNTSEFSAPVTVAPAPDSAPPTTVASTSPAPNAAGWNSAPVMVTIAAADNAGGSGGAATYYTVDGGARQTSAAPFVVPGDAVHTATFWSQDRAGNAETPNSLTIRTDATRPTLTFGTLSPAPNTAGWNNSAVSLPYTTAD